MNTRERIEDVTEEIAEELVDALTRCIYCKEPFKECDTLVPGFGLILGETDVVKHRGAYWHRGCVDDHEKGKWLKRSKISLFLRFRQLYQLIQKLLLLSR